MSDQHNSLPESPFSSNWRMYRFLEAHQFTVRAFTADELLDNMEDLTAKAESRGWSFLNSTGGNQQAQAPQAQPVPSMGQQPQQSMRGANTGVPMPSTVETFDGYVVGSYFSKLTKKNEPCVLLYTPNLQFRLFTVYPERAELLPFAYPQVPVASGAPRKDQAQAQGHFHAFNFSMKVYADLDENGNQKMRDGKDGRQYPIWRLPTREEWFADNPKPQAMAAHGNAGAPPPPPLPTRQIQQVNKNITPALDPSKEPLSPQSLRWTMADDAATVDDFGIPEPLDGWTIEQRAKVAHVIDDPKVDRMNDKQWDLLGEWMYEHVTQDSVEIEGIGSVPPVGLIMGVFVDRFVTDPKDVPAGVAVYFLQRLKKERQPGTPNPMYDSDFDENMRAVMAQAVASLAGESLAF